MSEQEIVQKLWNLCNILRDDGITYHQYVTELTYILFLKMANETGAEESIDEHYRWNNLASKSGLELKRFYNELLAYLGDKSTGKIQQIYQGSKSNIEEPKNLEKIIKGIDKFDWYQENKEGLGDLYEGLLEKNANEKKSGAGQYFTPRVLIDMMVKLIKPQLGETCYDPACGTFGFMIAANKYVKNKHDDYSISDKQYDFQKYKAFKGCELVHETHRLALMNAYLHNTEGEIMLGDALTSEAKKMKNFDVILTNPPFGTKKGGERSTRDDITYQTSNKQFNFLQVIYRSLKAGGRCAVVLPDNVLFATGEGQAIRKEFMDMCNLKAVLRLPTGIFYAQGVKTNVLFFTRGERDKGNTKEVCFYDMRSNMPKFGKTITLQSEDFTGFIKVYEALENGEFAINDRWSKYNRSEIASKGNTLDLGLIKDSGVTEYEYMQDPIESGEEIIANLEEAVDLIKSVVKELKALEVK
ncbi:MAG: type I restriction-modification system subunit M [Christensenellaceae bacterium]|jgi:type I restriction enzyme M protein|nr:type I restriction-modification system subunit M [Christensenellaceae bacterium]